jgi:hypothetical protein
MICSSGRSTMSMMMPLRMPESEMGLTAKAKWGLTPVSVQAWCIGPSGHCFLECRVKAKRNEYFPGCHWETLAPRPPEYSYKQEGPVQFQWVTRCNILNGDSFSENPSPFAPLRTTQIHYENGERRLPDALSPSCLSGSMKLLHLSKGKVLQHFMQLQH